MFFEGTDPSYGPPQVHLSIVIPAYNEQARLAKTLYKTINWCNENATRFEIIVVDDGSTDGTLALARLFEKQNPRTRVLSCPHMGKGAAVRAGMLNATGRYVLFMDADGATPLDEIPKLLAVLMSGYDVAVGSRVVSGLGLTVKTSIGRKMIGRVFASIVNVFAVANIRDTQCGFKMFQREVVRPIFSKQTIPGFAFDVEILFIAAKLHLSVAEVPVNWESQPGSKVNVVTDSVRMLRDILRVRRIHRRTGPDSVVRDFSSSSFKN